MTKIFSIREDASPTPATGDDDFIPRRTQQRRFNFLSASELIANQKPPIWTVKDYIEAGSLVSIIGAPGSGKTFLALDIGLHVAAGKNCHGLPVIQGLVLYVCGEGKSGIGRRIDALCRENNIARETLPFFVSTIPAQLLDKMSLAEVTAAAIEIMLKYGKPALIIIDTLNRNFGDGDENSTADMTRFIGSVDQLRSSFGCAVLVVHHTGIGAKDRGRGSTALRGAIDFEYLVTQTGRPRDNVRLIRMEAKKVKDFESPPILTFEPVVVDLGIFDEEGSPVTSLALRLTNTPSGSRTNAGRMTMAMRIALDGLKVVADESGQATLDDWRKAAYANKISKSEKQDTKQKAFNRAKDNLLEDGLIGIEGDKFYIVSQDTGQTGQ